MATTRASVTATTSGDGDAIAAGAAVRLVPVGELDIATAPPFLASLAAALHLRPASVEIELRWVTFIDARSVGAIAAASARMERWGGGLAACRPERAIRRMFEYCGLAYLLVPAAPAAVAPRPRALLPDLAARLAIAADAGGESRDP